MEKSESTLERIGAYRVVRRLATGGTSEVLLAKAEGPLGFERAVVLKLLLPSHQGDDELAKMFAREAAAYARLSHPSIVRLYDFFALGKDHANVSPGGVQRYPGQLVMVLEYVDGPTLQRLRAMLKTVGEHLDDRAAMHVAACIFEALAAAHQAIDESGAHAPVIHRDVNPANVLVPWDGHVKLADFGVAKVSGLTHQSSVGLIKGTYGYMAPEQVTGEVVTPRTDVYAGAIVLWEMLARRRAFIRGALPEIEVLRAMAEPRFPSIDVVRPDAPKAIRAALSRALDPAADRRQITGEELVGILRAQVSSDEGHDRLAKALSLVRHEPKVSTTSIPPPIAAPMPARASVEKPSRIPKPAAPPRPAPSRRTAAYGQPSAAAPPQPKPLTASTPLGRATATGLADALAPPTIADDFSDDERPTMVPVTEGPSTAIAPAQAPVDAPSAPRLDLGAAIEEVLRETPSSLPPEYPIDREIGRLPPPPPPLKIAVPSGGLNRTLALETPPVPMDPHLLETVRPPPESDDRQLTTAQMPKYVPAAGSPPLDVTMPLATAPTNPAARPLAQTAPLAFPSHPPPAPSHPPSAIPTSPPAGPRIWTEVPPEIPGVRRGLGSLVLMCFAAVFVAGAVGFGVLFYVRSRPSHGREGVVAPSAAPPVASTDAPAPPVPSPSEVPDATAAAAADAMAASVTATATDPSTADATAPSAGPDAAPLAATASSPPVSSGPPSDVTLGTGLVKTEGATAGRRIFVDDKTVGQTPEAVVVKCGVHQIKIGSAGTARAVDVPCGGEVIVR